MRTQFLFLSTLLAAAFALAPAAFAQDPNPDAITQIDGETPTTDASFIYFNAENCANASFTTYDLTLANGDGVTQAYLWVSGENGQCNLDDNRDPIDQKCVELPGGNPRTIGDNATITSLLLDELVATGVVDCNNGALEGQSYELYAFRNEAPGSTDVLPAGFGIAPFIVDVTAPEELSITSAAEQTGSTFNISWSAPTDSNSIAQYKLYQSDADDADTARFTGVTAGQNAKSISVSASALGLASESSTYLFVSAIDNAAMSIGNGNEGVLSESTFVTAAETTGFCDDPTVDCSGCSVSPMMLANGQPSSGVWLFGLLFAIVLGRRLHR